LSPGSATSPNYLSRLAWRFTPGGLLFGIYDVFGWYPVTHSRPESPVSGIARPGITPAGLFVEMSPVGETLDRQSGESRKLSRRNPMGA
jgi:hypothetical protein